MKPPFYSETDVERVLDEKASFRLAHETFRLLARRAAQMPPKLYLNLALGDFRAMPAAVGEGGRAACGVKWISVFPRNRGLGFPTVNGTILLNSPRSGQLLAVVSANAITAMRTAGAAAVATAYLANPRPRRLAIVGAGIQARYQLAALASRHRFASIRVWGYLPGEAESFCRHTPRPLTPQPAATVEACVKDADVIVTCTSSRRPLVKRAWVKPGAHINAVGADAQGKQELETALVRAAAVVVDEWRQASHSGEINVPCSQGKFSKSRLRAELSDVVSGRVRGRRSAREITVFDSTGLAVLDIWFADYVRRALQRKRRPPRA